MNDLKIGSKISIKNQVCTVIKIEGKKIQAVSSIGRNTWGHWFPFVYEVSLKSVESCDAWQTPFESKIKSPKVIAPEVTNEMRVAHYKKAHS